MLWARDRLLQALATVDGITPAASAPDAPVANVAWPKWAESRLQGGKLTQPLVHSFDVLVLLNASYDGQTVAAADDLLPRLIGSLAAVASIDVADAVQVTFPPATAIPALRVRCTPRPERIPTHASR